MIDAQRRRMRLRSRHVDTRTAKGRVALAQAYADRPVALEILESSPVTLRVDERPHVRLHDDHGVDVVEVVMHAN